MSRKERADGSEWARPITDTVGDVELEYAVVITMEMMPTGRKGVLEVKLMAYDTARKPTARPMCVVSNDWPHATVQSLPALLYNLTFKLGRLVEDSRRDQDMRGEVWRV